MDERRSDENTNGAGALPIARSAEHVQRHPEEWVTEDAPMTEAQARLLRRLCAALGEPFDAGLSKGAASQRIETLQTRTGRDPTDGVLLDEQTDG